MQRFISLLILATIMGIASYGAGLLPLKTSIAKHHMKLVSALSVGILIGTALAVVIPEGVETVFESTKNSPLSVTGASLLSGFIAMFLVDHYASIAAIFNVESSVQTEGDSVQEKFKSILQSTLTLGLILHSFVDGIALGTSFFHGDDSFPVIFFVMIIVHKLPTAFSLAVVLVQEGFTQEVINFHLIVFSLATPLASFMAFLVISFLGLDSPFAVGILLLFSAGTFLYSVMHVMMEILDKGDDQQGGSLSPPALLLSVIGMILPIILTLSGGD